LFITSCIEKQCTQPLANLKVYHRQDLVVLAYSAKGVQTLILSYFNIDLKITKKFLI